MGERVSAWYDVERERRRVLFWRVVFIPSMSEKEVNVDASYVAGADSKKKARKPFRVPIRVSSINGKSVIPTAYPHKSGNLSILF